MSVAMAGIVFRRADEAFNPAELASRLFQKQARILAEPVDRSFDCREASDVLIERYGDVWVIANDALTMPLIENRPHAVSSVHETLGSPALMIAFCQYESADAYGYALVEKGGVTRSRLQLCDRPLQQFGPLKPFEQKWDAAPFFLDEDDCPEDQWQKIYYLGDREVTVTEHFLTSRLAYEALTESFAICPWDTDIKPERWHVRLHDSTASAVQATQTSGKQKAWWKFW